MPILGEGSVSPERLATALRWTPAEVEAFLRSAGLVVDAEGHVRTVAGAGCALDTLLFPPLTGRSARVVSTCPATERPIRLAVSPQGIEDLDPPGAVLSLRLPGPETSAGTVQDTIWGQLTKRTTSYAKPRWASAPAGICPPRPIGFSCAVLCFDRAQGRVVALPPDHAFGERGHELAVSAKDGSIRPEIE